jgi:hypothetical protein
MRIRFVDKASAEFLDGIEFSTLWVLGHCSPKPKARVLDSTRKEDYLKVLAIGHLTKSIILLPVTP